ncbi:hypothetical protein QBC37DRAFT_126143 [Rhypophila decipiens]|uniref:Uncharacterized protein n=1 Tax=Rhypophila decipiens TaxID=261697 RepID=A0AAN6XTS3_9PEZI|nr:hypothetical protein QBC37DRAFT_126143 [Rhypophila decipiens]
MTTIQSSLLLILLGHATAADLIFMGSVYPECTTCEEQAYNLCDTSPPADPWADRSFATCFCGGGVTIPQAVLECFDICDTVDIYDMRASRMAAESWFYYCAVWFPEEVCPAAEGWLSEKYYREQCGGITAGSGGSGSGGAVDEED